ncbi:MAG: hypothetical protein NT113_06255, partial [Hyphomicrobiales bacterium]|nr:hypothetical protein [Hyphomicrobiales bacterium]
MLAAIIPIGPSSRLRFDPALDDDLRRRTIVKYCCGGATPAAPMRRFVASCFVFVNDVDDHSVARGEIALILKIIDVNVRDPACLVADPNRLQSASRKHFQGLTEKDRGARCFDPLVEQIAATDQKGAYLVLGEHTSALQTQRGVQHGVGRRHA